jgi:hypothetical protein
MRIPYVIRSSSLLYLWQHRRYYKISAWQTLLQQLGRSIEIEEKLRPAEKHPNHTLIFTMNP